MPLTCILLHPAHQDNEPLQHHITACPRLSILKCFTDTASRNNFLRHHRIDLVFINRRVPVREDIAFAKALPANIVIIFTTTNTGFPEVELNGHTVEFLVKPFSSEKLTEVVEKQARRSPLSKTPTEKESLFVRAEYQLLRLTLDDILFIESMQDYLKIHLSGGRPVITLMTMKRMVEKLPPEGFRRVHRSYLISTSKVKSVVNRKVTLVNDVQLPVSNRYAGVVSAWR